MAVNDEVEAPKSSALQTHQTSRGYHFDARVPKSAAGQAGPSVKTPKVRQGRVKVRPRPPIGLSALPSEKAATLTCSTIGEAVFDDSARAADHAVGAIFWEDERFQRCSEE
jgi:hypothetical protein